MLTTCAGLAPFRRRSDATRLAGAGAVAAAGGAVLAAGAAALAGVAVSQQAAHHVHLWPSWRRLGGGTPAAVAGRVVELLAAAAPLLLVTACHPYLHPVVVWRWLGPLGPGGVWRCLLCAV